MTALSDDYSKLLQAVESGTAPDAGLESKMNTDAQAMDTLCSFGR